MNVLVLTVFANPEQSNAAVASKVATKAAVKVAKEIGADIAVQMAEDILFNYQMENWLSGKYDADEGYKPVCLDKKTSEQKGSCDKPAQVKQVKTASEKKTIANKVEEVLERKTGMNGWTKFLDWFVPIFLVSGVVTWISHKFDSETDGLFDEVAKESLQETGFIKSIKPNVTEVITSPEGGDLQYPPIDNPIETGLPTHSIPDVSIAQEVKFVSTKSSSSSFSMPTPDVLQSVGYVHIQRDVYNQDPLFSSSAITVSLTGEPNQTFKIFNNSGNLLFSATNPNALSVGSALLANEKPRIDFYKNGVYQAGRNTTSVTNETGPAPSANEITDIMIYPTQAVLGETSKRPQTTDGIKPDSYYLQRKITFITANGDNYDVYSTSRFYPSLPPSVGAFNKVTYTENHTQMQASQLAVKVHVFSNIKTVTLTEYNPTIEDMPMDIQIVQRGTTVVPPPIAVPIKTPEGVSVTPSDKVPSGWVDRGTGEEVIVNEDELIVEDVDPNIIETPKPNPEGVEPNPDKEEDNETDYPSCDKDFEKIEFEKVGVAFTYAFPFSIPWDIKRMVDAQLGGIGDAKPSFELSFLGDGIELTIPDFIDKWMPFARGIMIFMFDISILFLFYRFMKGGGD